MLKACVMIFLIILPFLVPFGRSDVWLRLAISVAILVYWRNSDGDGETTAE